MLVWVLEYEEPAFTYYFQGDQEKITALTMRQELAEIKPDEYDEVEVRPLGYSDPTPHPRTSQFGEDTRN